MLTRRLLLSAVALAATPAVAAAPIYVPDGDPGLSPRGQGMVRALKATIRAEQARQAGLPPASPAERLARMARLEQAAREAPTWACRRWRSGISGPRRGVSPPHRGRWRGAAEGGAVTEGVARDLSGPPQSPLRGDSSPDGEHLH